ncbi:MAG: glycerate kinase [Victivallales bacterium]|jgi:glycerate kinase
MDIVIAVNAFKGSLSCIEASNAISRGIRKALPAAKIVSCPVADGGDGLLDVVKSLPSVKTVKCKVLDPRKKKINSEFCWLENEKTAFIEMALASGLALLPERLRNPIETTTYGTGQLIAEALKLKPRKIILGIGGSATCDGGVGAASALGAKFSDKAGKFITIPDGGDLKRIDSIDLTGTDKRLKNTDIEIICDVGNPLLGPKGAAAVYAPQKGATPAQVKELENGLAIFADKVRKYTKKDIRKMKGGGAAGGISAGFHALFGAKLKAGIDVVLALVDLEKKIKKADLVITGEGKIDSQTAYGKAPAGVAKLAKKHGVPCIALCGCAGRNISSLKKTGIKSVYPIRMEAKSAEDSMKNAAKYLEITAEKAMWKCGSSKIRRR